MLHCKVWKHAFLRAWAYWVSDLETSQETKNTPRVDWVLNYALKTFLCENNWVFLLKNSYAFSLFGFSLLEIVRNREGLQTSVNTMDQGAFQPYDSVQSTKIYNFKCLDLHFQSNKVKCFLFSFWLIVEGFLSSSTSRTKGAFQPGVRICQMLVLGMTYLLPVRHEQEIYSSLKQVKCVSPSPSCNLSLIHTELHLGT